MSHRRYAENTRVPVGQSRTEIERILERYKADQFLYGHECGRAVVGFRMAGRQVKIVLPVPTGQTPADERETRRRWRPLAMIIKAKLEAVASGVSVFDDEFLAHIVLPDGKTVGEHLRPQIKLSYERGTMPPLLPAPGGNGA